MAAIGGALSSSQIQSLIQQANTAFLAPVTTLQAQEKPIQAQISALGTVQNALSSLQSAVSSLADISTLPQRSVSASPTGVVQASATNNAAVGTYSLSGIHLAQSEQLVSSGFSVASGSFGSGSLTIQVGTNTAVTVNISNGQSTLADIAAAIDQADLGVQASVAFDGSKYHLLLSGDTTGSANAFTVTGSGGLAAFSYYTGVSGSSLAQTQSAGDASFSLNGIAVTSGSNNVSGVISGLSFTLAASGSATVTVNQSVSALDSAAQSLVSALNSALSTINQLSSYNVTSGAGPLLGNVGLQIIRTQLLDAITAPPVVGAAHPRAYNSLAAIGFGIDSNGTVTLNDSVFQAAAQSNYGAAASLIGGIAIASNPQVTVNRISLSQPGTYAINVTSNSDGNVVGSVNGQAASGTGGELVVAGSGPAQGLTLQLAAGITGDLGTVTVSQGLFGSLSNALNNALSIGNGGITSQIKGLNSSLTTMNDQIATLQKLAQQQTISLTNQYSVAQATLSQLGTVSDFLTTYFHMTSGA